MLLYSRQVSNFKIETTNPILPFFTLFSLSFSLRILCDLTVSPSVGADNNLAIDTITSQGGATCSFFGVDGATVTIVGAHSATVAPPQAIQSGSCLAL